MIISTNQSWFMGLKTAWRPPLDISSLVYHLPLIAVLWFLVVFSYLVLRSLPEREDLVLSRVSHWLFYNNWGLWCKRWARWPATPWRALTKMNISLGSFLWKLHLEAVLENLEFLLRDHCGILGVFDGLTVFMSLIRFEAPLSCRSMLKPSFRGSVMAIL